MQESRTTKKHFKSTYILAIIFLVLVAIFWVMRRDKGEGELGLFFPILNVEAINKIEITRASREQVVLEKREGVWLVIGGREAPAEPTYVEGALGAVREMKVGEAVSENPSKQSTFEVDKSGTEVKLEQGGELLAHFYIGKFGPDYNSNYVRKEGSDKVYLSQGAIRDDFARQDFRSLGILFFRPETVGRVSLKYKEESQEDVILEKRGVVWLVNDSEADKSKAEDFLKYVADLKAEDIIELEEDDEPGFEESQIELSLELDDGSEKILIIGKGYKQAATYYAKAGGEDTIYMITQGQRDELLKNVDDFK